MMLILDRFKLGGSIVQVLFDGLYLGMKGSSLLSQSPCTYVSEVEITKYNRIVFLFKINTKHYYNWQCHNHGTVMYYTILDWRKWSFYFKSWH